MVRLPAQSIAAAARSEAGAVTPRLKGLLSVPVFQHELSVLQILGVWVPRCVPQVSVTFLWYDIMLIC